MLVREFGNCENCGGDLGLNATIQSTHVTCKNCGHEFKACEQCKGAGCPQCGGDLLDAWEIYKHKTGRDILF